MSMNEFEVLRQRMLAEISAGAFQASGLIDKPAFDERVMAALAKVPRHEFVPVELQAYAYANVPLPIGFDKTISQPFIVALMTDLLEIGADDAVLEIGTGLGYQAAILAGRCTASRSSRSSGNRQATTPPTGLHQRQGQDCEWLSWLVRARAVR